MGNLLNISGGSLLKKGLPYDAEIEYLESSGTQWINTKHAFSGSFAWEIKCSTPAPNTTAFGARTSLLRSSVLFNNNGAIGVAIGTMSTASSPFQFGNISGVHTYKLDVVAQKGSTWLDGVSLQNNVSFQGDYVTNIPQAIFANNFGKNVQELSSIRVYNAKMWQTNKLVRDLIPVRVGTTGYMYDKVSGQLFGNSGTGSFMLGPDKQ